MTHAKSKSVRGNAAPESKSADRARAMFALLETQHELHDGLADLAARQQKSITVEDTRPLLDILSKRERLTTQLLGVGARLKPLLADFDALLLELTEEKRKAARAMVALAKKRLGELIAGDAEDAQKLQMRKQRTSDALRSTHANRQAVAAYGGAAAQFGSTRVQENA